MNIIDIRNKKEYEIGHIPGAISIDSYELLFNPSKYLNKNETYHIYCNSGITSNGVVSKLNSMGYKCVNIDGGYKKYLLSKKKL